MRFNIRKATGFFLIATLAFSIAYAVVNIIMLSGTEISETGKQKSDYVLMLIQCILGLAIMFLPSILEKKLSFTMPNKIYVLFFLFLYCAIFLGEVRDFYYIVPGWDKILHFFSGGMLGILGYLVVDFFNEYQNARVTLSPVFLAVFALSFAIAMGTVWEIYEYACDGVFGLNMQKFRTDDGVSLIGREALSDTMNDIIIDSVGAFITVAVCFIDSIGIKFFNKRREKNLKNHKKPCDI